MTNKYLKFIDFKISKIALEQSHITLEEEETHEEFLQEHGITRICTKFERNMRLFFMAHAAVALFLLILVLVFFKNKSARNGKDDVEEE